MECKHDDRIAYLVLGVNLGQLDRLLEDTILVLFELDCLPPVVKGASHIDLIGRVFPMRK